MTKIYEKEIRRYHLKAGDGDYGTVALDIGQRSVTVMAESSFGSYCYHWNSTGCNPIEFLGNIKFHYAMLKFRGPAYQVFDREAQEKVMRQRTIARRRARIIEADDAKWAWDELEHVCDAYSLDQFWANLYHSDICKHLGIECGEFSAETRPDPQCVGFWEAIWVPLMKHLAEAEQTAPEAEEAAA